MILFTISLKLYKLQNCGKVATSYEYIKKMVSCLLIELIHNKFLPLFVNYVNNEKSNFVKKYLISVPYSL